MRRCRVPHDGHLLLGVSGGADSVALLRGVGALGRQRHCRWQVQVAHVQHHLRDQDGEAERDAEFVAALCDAETLAYHREDLPPTTWAVGNTESEARRQRYQRLEAVAQRVAADCVVVAHHADDQLETILMRLLRGTSVRGLRGMPWRRPIHPGSTVQLVRPMLATDRAEARAFLATLGQAWCEDTTNTDRSRTRNRLREEVVPVLQEIAPHLAGQTVRFADHCRQVAACLDRMTNEAAPETRRDARGIVLDRVTARRMPALVLTSLLRRLLIEAGARPDRLGHRVLRPLVRAVRDGAGHQRMFQLSGGVQVEVSGDTVVVQDRGAK